MKGILRRDIGVIEATEEVEKECLRGRQNAFC